MGIGQRIKRAIVSVTVLAFAMVEARLRAVCSSVGEEEGRLVEMGPEGGSSRSDGTRSSSLARRI